MFSCGSELPALWPMIPLFSGCTHVAPEAGV